ncbi:hypothetical protein HK104_003032 [Borealophlyctis nickersoniae]|nr:hypothetical protein HK104_003032 [Borealophlyctis nickersoniae]
MINQERNMLPKLNELDRMVEDAKRRAEEGQKVEGGGGTRLMPEEIMRARRVEVKRMEVERLRGVLSEVNSQTTHLKTTLDTERAHVDALRQSIDEAACKMIPRELLGEFETELEVGFAEAMAAEAAAGNYQLVQR